MSTCRHLTIDVSDTTGGDLRDLTRELKRLEQLENELSLAQRWVQGRVTDVRDRIDENVDDGDGRVYAEIVSALANGQASVDAIAREIEAPPEMVEEALDRLTRMDIVEQSGDGWTLR
jgi:ArsR family transcriptional regulator